MSAPASSALRELTFKKLFTLPGKKLAESTPIVSPEDMMPIDALALSNSRASKAHYMQALADIKPLDPVVTSLYKKAYDQVAPVFIGATDQVLRKAAVKKDAQLLFIARDGIGGYEIAKQLLKQFPQRYPGITEKSLHYVYLNKDTIYSPHMKEYLKQECHLSKNSAVFPVDLGWYGSLDYQFSQLFDGELGQYQGLNLTLSPNRYSGIHPYIHLDPNPGPFGYMSGNPAVHFMEDTFSGLSGRPNTLHREPSGKIIPNIPTAPYSDEVKTKRQWALKALSDAGADISLPELDAITPESAGKKLFDLMDQPSKFKSLMVPHEKH